MDKTASKLIAAFVALIVGAVLIAQIATTSSSVTDLAGANNETLDISVARVANGAINSSYTFTVTNAPTGWKKNSADCDISTNFKIYNYTGNLLSPTSTYATVASDGTFTLKAIAPLNRSQGNITAIDYTYCPDGYVDSAWGRTSLDVTLGLFAVAVLLVAVGLFYSVAKDYGIA